MNGEFKDQKPLTSAQIAANAIFADNVETAVSDNVTKEKAFHENRERLKAERMAREAESRGETIAALQVSVTAQPESVSTNPRLKQLLFHYGLPDNDFALVEPHKNHKGVWRIKFSYEESEPLSMDIEQASQLATGLHDISHGERACEVEDAIRQAIRYTRM